MPNESFKRKAANEKKEAIEGARSLFRSDRQNDPDIENAQENNLESECPTKTQNNTDIMASQNNNVGRNHDTIDELTPEEPPPDDLESPIPTHSILRKLKKKNATRPPSCTGCSKFSRSSKILMLTEVQHWNVQTEKVCQAKDEAIVLIRAFRPNLIRLGNNKISHRFTQYWTKLIRNLGNNKSPLQHIAGIMVQSFPALFLQSISDNNSDNKEAVERRLDKWKGGHFHKIMDEAEQIQITLKQGAKSKPKRRNNTKTLTAKFFEEQVIEALNDANIKKASQTFNPDNHGLLAWSKTVKDDLRQRFPISKSIISKRPSTATQFKETIILSNDIMIVVSQGNTKAGGISHVGYDQVKSMSYLKDTGPELLKAIAKTTMSLANNRIPNLYHWMALRTIQIAKKDGSGRPVGIGVVIRRICLKAINRKHHE